jgi:glucokinase
VAIDGQPFGEADNVATLTETGHGIVQDRPAGGPPDPPAAFRFSRLQSPAKRGTNQAGPNMLRTAASATRHRVVRRTFKSRDPGLEATTMPDDPSGSRLYAGIDVGGTKIQTSLVEESGAVVARKRCPTPHEGPAEDTLAAIERTLVEVLEGEGLEASDLSAIGIAVPGVVDPKKGRVVVTPNMNLSDTQIVARLEARFGVPVALGNDTDLGTLGETWLGAARGARSAFGIFVGTGVGGGFVQKQRLWSGHRNAAGEIGHIVMEIDGPECGCGNRGCLEAVASRSAIERDLRAAIDSGTETVLTDLLGDDLGRIKSGKLAAALDEGDRLVQEVMGHAAVVLGHACLTVRHLLDPEVIVIGGGVFEACGNFLFPIIRRIVDADRLPGARKGGQVLLSALEDDAVTLGAVALARQKVKRDPFKKKFAVRPDYPELRWAETGKVAVGDEVYDRDFYVRVNGKVKPYKGFRKQNGDNGGLQVEAKPLSKVCKGGPEIVFVGTGGGKNVRLSEDAEAFLRRRAIDCETRPTPQAVEAYNRCKRRKAVLICVDA